MRYLIDTNIWLYVASGEPEAVSFLNRAATAEWTGYSSITRLELFGYPDLKAGDEAKLSAMLSCFAEVEVHSQVIDKAIEIRKAQRIRAPDAIIAATAIVMGACLVTRNTTDFAKIIGLKLEDPFAGRKSSSSPTGNVDNLDKGGQGVDRGGQQPKNGTKRDAAT